VKYLAQEKFVNQKVDPKTVQGLLPLDFAQCHDADLHACPRQGKREAVARYEERWQTKKQITGTKSQVERARGLKW
jgi:hypothetical protein